MRRVGAPSTFLLSFDLLSEIDTYPIELGNHRLDLVRSQAVLSDFKFLTAAQTLLLVYFHGRLQIVSLRDIGHVDSGNSAKVGPTRHFSCPKAQTERPPGGGLSEIRSGGLAKVRTQAAVDQCPLLSNNGQNAAVPRMSALCQ